VLLKHFNLSNYSYSLPWRTVAVNQQHLSADTTNSMYQDIINTITVDIPSNSYAFGPEVVMDRGVRNGSYINAQTYKGLLKTTVFEPSCISLITEPAFYERETIITEKTIMAIYGGTIPIWVGGWRIADWLRDRGFDVFDDIVDHSYQNLADPYDRCYQAIYKNLDLLKNFTNAQDHVRKNIDRLKANFDLLNQNHFYDECQAKMKSLGVKLF
jgi:hypothetical protein